MSERKNSARPKVKATSRVEKSEAAFAVLIPLYVGCGYVSQCARAHKDVLPNSIKR